jgi:glycerol dehydrogenase-like iron-containing ADH family enzyme
MQTFNFPKVYFVEHEVDSLVNWIAERSVIFLGGETALSKLKPFINSSIPNFDEQKIIYGKECTWDNIHRLSKDTRLIACDLIVCVGGGKALDTAKAVAHHLNKPSLTIPTLAGTCAATTKVSVIYTAEHKALEVLALRHTPEAVFIFPQLLLEAPKSYLWAGIGDTLAKPVEVEFSLRNKELSVQENYALHMSKLCISECQSLGVIAMQDQSAQKLSEAFRRVVFTIIVTTGYVSNLVGVEFTASLAHALFYALTALEEIELNHLHGEVVSYGVLVLLTLDQQHELIQALLPLYRGIQLPYRLSMLHLPSERSFYESILEEAANSPDLIEAAYPISKDDIYQAMMRLEALEEAI